MGVEWPVGFGQAAYRLALTGKANRFVITIGHKDTALTSANAVATALFGAISHATLDRPLGAFNMSNKYTFEGVTYTRGPSTGGEIGVHNQNVVGTKTGDAPTPGVSVLVRKNTALGGRKGRGRLFLPASHISESDVDHLGVILPAALTNLQTGWTNFHAALVTAGFEPYLFHSDATLPPTAITSFTVQSLVATQRRRLR